MKNYYPLANFKDIVVQELKDEVLVCDTKSNRVFCLNQTAGEVWKLCDGKTDVKEIAKILSKKLRANVSEEMVLLALHELAKENLLAGKSETEQIFAGISRREVIRRIGLGSMIALPIISSVVMPMATQAQSGCFSAGDGCDTDAECCNNCCNFGTCVDGLAAPGQACNANADCCSDACSGTPGVCIRPS